MSNIATDDNKILNGTYVIHGGYPLNGSVSLPGAKNAAIPAIVAACLSDEKVTLENVPLELNDVIILLELLKSIGVEMEKTTPTTIEISGKNIHDAIIDRDKAGAIRHSLLLLGLSAAKGSSLSLCVPGGCSIGERKHDLHIMALSKLGYRIDESEQGISLYAEQYRNNSEIIEVFFHYPTFGGTLNAIFASVLLEGQAFIIRNPAKNPEVLDVINILQLMGADINWTDASTLIINGVKKLHGTNYKIMSDRIIAATLMAAIGATGGEGVVIGADSKYLKDEIDAWLKAGLIIKSIKEGIYVKGSCNIAPVDIETNAYPAFHTDIQPLHGVLMAIGRETSMIKENILDGRFQYCYELNKLGANIEVRDGGFICVNGAPGQIAYFHQTASLKGSSDLVATDIRGGAAIVIGALAAMGKSIISNVYQIERGYSHLPEMLSELGADIKRSN